MAKKRAGFFIDDKTDNDQLFSEHYGRGHDPEQAKANSGMFEAPPASFTLIPRSEWDARYDEQQARKTGLRHIRATMNKGKPHKSLDQNGQGYCWAYSVGAMIMYRRGADNQPYARLSPHAVAWKIKGGRDEGGWCGLSMKYAIETGYPTEKTWPQKSMNRANDTAATWAEAEKYRVTESCFDIGKAVWDQTMLVDLVATMLLLNIPCALDFNWWGHSVCGIEWTRYEPGAWGPTIDNSWTPAWGDDGLATLKGSRAVPDGGVACLVASAAA